MTTDELCERLRVTRREVHWWANTGLVPCRRGLGGCREFDDDGALAAAIVADLRRKGVSLHRIRGLHIRHPHREYLAVGRAGPGGRTCFWWCGERDLLKHVAACPGPCLVVSVEDLRKRLHDQDPPRFARRKAN